MEENELQNTIFIVVPGVPVAKGRAKFRQFNGFVSTYTPAKTRNYEQAISDCAKAAMDGKEIIEVACRIHVRAYVPIPKSTTKKVMAMILAGEKHPVTRPDVDNYLKAASDALNGIVFKDDSQCWRATAEKHYAQHPRLEIEVKY